MATSGHDVAICVALDARENLNANISLGVALETRKFTKKSGCIKPAPCIFQFPPTYSNFRKTKNKTQKHSHSSLFLYYTKTLTLISLSLLHENTHALSWRLSPLISLGVSLCSSLSASLSGLISSSLSTSLFDHLNIEVNTFILLLLQFNLGV